MGKFAWWNKNRKAKFVLSNSKDGQYYFTFRSKNGNTIVTSQMYNQKYSAINGITSIRDSILKDGQDIKILDET